MNTAATTPIVSMLIQLREMLKCDTLEEIKKGLPTILRLDLHPRHVHRGRRRPYVPIWFLSAATSCFGFY